MEAFRLDNEIEGIYKNCLYDGNTLGFTSYTLLELVSKLVCHSQEETSGRCEEALIATNTAPVVRHQGEFLLPRSEILRSAQDDMLEITRRYYGMRLALFASLHGGKK